MNIVIANTNIRINGFASNKESHIIFSEKTLTNNKSALIIDVKKFRQEHVVAEKFQEHTYNDMDDKGNIIISIYNRNDNILYGKLWICRDYSCATIELLETNIHYMSATFDYLLFYVFQIKLLFSNGINIHAAAIEYNNEGILFTAPSQTGKTTQAKLWEMHEDAKIINGDRPIITISESKIFVNGSPWSGSDPVYRNVSYPIKAIVLLQQSLVNRVLKLAPKEAFIEMISEVFVPYFNDELVELSFKHLETILELVPIYKLYCRPDEEAVKVLKEQLGLLTE